MITNVSTSPKSCFGLILFAFHFAFHAPGANMHVSAYWRHVLKPEKNETELPKRNERNGQSHRNESRPKQSKPPKFNLVIYDSYSPVVLNIKRSG